MTWKYSILQGLNQGVAKGLKPPSLRQDKFKKKKISDSFDIFIVSQ